MRCGLGRRPNFSFGHERRRIQDNFPCAIPPGRWCIGDHARQASIRLVLGMEVDSYIPIMALFASSIEGRVGVNVSRVSLTVQWLVASPGSLAPVGLDAGPPESTLMERGLVSWAPRESQESAADLQHRRGVGACHPRCVCVR